MLHLCDRRLAPTDRKICGRKMIDPAHALAFSVFENKGVYALLLGSGLSRAAQIPTGWEITIDLTRRVAALEGVTGETDWEAWHQSRFGEPPSYSKLLDRLSSTAAERRSILHSYIEPSAEDLETGVRQPTKAHHAIARMVRDGYIRVLITTNFDRLIENALREAGVEPTVIKSEDDLAGAIPLAHARCFVLKVHGDYLDTRLLNTDSELDQYGETQNRLLDRIFDEHGLIVCGWSGDWDAALRGAIARAPSRRYPVYWASRGVPSAIAQDLINNRRGQLIAIEDADSFFFELQQSLETLETAARPNPLTADLLVGTAKRYLAKSEYRIHLTDLVTAEVDRARKIIEGRGLMNPQGPYKEEEFIGRVAVYDSSYEVLCRMGYAMGRWGTENEFRLAQDVLLTLSRIPALSGLTIWIELMAYPAVLFFSSYALGLTKRDQLDVLYRWLNTSVPYKSRSEHPAFEVYFCQMWSGAKIDLWSIFFRPQQIKTPLNDAILNKFKNWLSREFLDGADIEITFEWLELLVGILMTASRINKADLAACISGKPGQRDYVPSTIGRVAWHSENQGILLGRMVQDPTASQLLSAGFADGDREFLKLLHVNFQRLIKWDF